jgi:16S rRNA (cytosine967-C5)-methyltransferase
MRNEGSVIAQDQSEERLKLVAENCKRLGVTNCECLVTPKSTRFDRVLVDAPCSNTGVMRRRVDLRWRLRLSEIERLRRSQLDLLNRAAGQVRPAGVLVYSTCSLEWEENQEVVKEFLVNQSRFQLERERELRPFNEGVDGAYVARMKRTD